MNKYKVTSQVNEDFVDTEVEADAVGTLKTGQIIFYNVTDDEHETVAIFPATCAVIKIEEDEDAIFKAAQQKIEKNYSAGTYEVPAGNANTVINTDFDFIPDKKKEEGKMNLRYDSYTATFEGETGHPQIVMEQLRITYREAVPQSLGDQWWFFDCENVPKELPKFLTEMK